jgi:hypothetical protein
MSSISPVLYLEEVSSYDRSFDFRAFVFYAGYDTYVVHFTRRDTKCKSFPDVRLEFLTRDALATFLCYSIDAEENRVNITLFMLDFDQLSGGNSFSSYHDLYKTTRRRQEIFGYDDCSSKTFNYDALMELAMILRDARAN